MTQDPSNDLSRLINAAENAVDKKEARQAPSTRKRPASPWLVPGILLVIIAASLAALWSELRPPGAADIARDLEAIVARARDAIEAARGANGELPATVPNAALASIVRYEKGEKDYRLSATAMGVRVTREPDGKTTTEKGVPN
jgi:hypothetical protein